MFLSEASNDFLFYLQHRRNATATTLITYRSILGQFVAYMGQIEAKDLTIAMIDGFATNYALRGFKPKTYRNKLCIVKSFVKYMYAHNLSDIRPESVEVPPLREAEDMAWLTEEEGEDILRAARHNIRDYAMLKVLLSSGLRVSELCNLKTGDIYQRTISVKQGKGRKNRVTFMDSGAEKALNRYYRRKRGYEIGFVFPNPQGKSLSQAIVARKVHIYATAARINKHVTVHTMRHTFATGYLNAGGRVEDLQQMLGHADMKTTLLYTHFTNERLHGAYDKIMASRQ